MPFSNILGVFAQSPIKPLVEHINKVHSCCEALIPFFEAAFAKDWELASTRHNDVSMKEKEADALKASARSRLPAGIFMPVERTDMLNLLSQQDKMANRAKDVSGRILGRCLEIPEPIAEDFMAYIKRCIDAVEQARKAVNELDDLLETGFAGREVNLVENMVAELDKIEDDTDHMQILLRRKLMGLESDMNPIDVMFLYKVFELAGDIANSADSAGSRLEQMLSRF
ncbi:TIGR00153 family protein [Echinimonas agarilytica]|uniref:TIGR00153 family protein n=1 Tax=Echinimonas agarilytica TaxID=1215918 RepID=A0AA41W926_9GAMM|nr:TIGR00153 family protein [Echinimonas agarilytica]MCM2680384.1 TIGR00153 family protein [Echinimonas agarilytica]